MHYQIVILPVLTINYKRTILSASVRKQVLRQGHCDMENTLIMLMKRHACMMTVIA